MGTTRGHATHRSRTARARIGAVAAALALGTLVMAACGPPEDPVVTLLDEIVENASDRDAAGIAECLAEDIDAGGQGKADVERTLRQYLGGYQALDVSYSDLEILREASSARATFKVRMTGVPRAIGGLSDLLPRTAAYSFEIVLRREGDRWLVTQATWTGAD